MHSVESHSAVRQASVSWDALNIQTTNSCGTPVFSIGDSEQDVSVACVGGQNHSKHCRAAWMMMDDRHWV